MANTLYDNARELFATAGLSWTAATIKATLIDSGSYPFNATHTHYDDVSGGGIVATSSAFTAKTATGGACDAADVTFTAVSGASVEAILIWSDSGTPSTSPLIAWIDTATGLPITPNGGDIIVVWDNGANKIFKL
jgi:hypothetical protein